MTKTTETTPRTQPSAPFSPGRPPAWLTAVVAPALVALLAACGGDGNGADGGASGAEARGGQPPAPPACDQLAALSPDSMRAAGDGLRILQREEGEGRAAAAGDSVTAHYVGCLTDGTKFDASYDRNEPISFPLGAGKVIPGWDQGIEGMKPGGVRVLRVPPELGYGSRGTPQGPIPPDATLLFHVRLVDVTPGAGAGEG